MPRRRPRLQQARYHPDGNHQGRSRRGSGRIAEVLRDRRRSLRRDDGDDDARQLSRAPYAIRRNLSLVLQVFGRARMKIGVLAFVTPVTADPAALARKAEELGFESFYLPEHP